MPANVIQGADCDAFVTKTLDERLQGCANWPSKFLPEQWSVYKPLLLRLAEREIPFAVGGALAAMTYADQWRNTKDLDLYVLHQDVERIIPFLDDAGLVDYYDELAYDRRWIYRGHRRDSTGGEIIVDLIWAMANQRAQVEESWFQGPQVEAGGVRFRLLGPEMAVWSKLYVLQHDRSDWPDCFNVLNGVGPEMDWSRLISSTGDDLALLAGLVSVFSWLSPARARELPECIWPALKLSPPAESGDVHLIARRAALLDSRPWFFPVPENEYQPSNK